MEFQGHVSAGGPASAGKAPYRLTGTLTGKGLGYVHQSIEISGISLASHADLSSDRFAFRTWILPCPKGTFMGWRRSRSST